jgi:hypothetical protein
MSRVKSFAEKLDKGLSKVFGIFPSPSSKAPQEVTSLSTPAKPKEKSFFQKTFRSDERKKLEAYTLASTDAEKEAILATMKKI